MSVIAIDLAMHHLLAEPEDQDLVQNLLDASESAAMQYLNRRFYVDQADLDSAKASVAILMKSARDDHSEAVAAAELEQDCATRLRLLSHARQALADAYEAADSIAFGIVINPAITAACLLKLGKLFADREDDAELPMASRALLNPSRIRMGA